MTRLEAITKWGEKIVVRAEEIFEKQAQFMLRALEDKESSTLFWHDLTEDSRMHYFRVARGVMIRFILIDHDNHRDDCYTIYKTFEKARTEAHKFIAGAKSHYNEPEPYTRGDESATTCPWGQYGEERWSIHIEEIEVPV